MDEDLANAAVREVHGGALEESVAQPAAAEPGKYGKAQLRAGGVVRHVRHRDEAHVLAGDREDRVATEVDALIEPSDGLVGDRRPEAQPPVLGIEREEMIGNRGPVGFAQADGQGSTLRHGASLDRAVARVMGSPGGKQGRCHRFSHPELGL
ncbi:MAG: hypothetical protein IPH30_06510 [Betaproteobacteria bacterium]|nr:hypothetical protein [Betaproteobacteria bacterium]